MKPEEKLVAFIFCMLFILVAYMTHRVCNYYEAVEKEAIKNNYQLYPR